MIADASGSTPLVGMQLMDKHTLTIDIQNAGQVLIQPIPE